MRAVLCALLAALAAAERGSAPRCRHERCRFIADFGYDGLFYEVYGKNLTIYISKNYASYDAKDHLKIDCNGASVLESPALPCFVAALHVSHVELNNCPLPTAASLSDTLVTLNVTLEYGYSDKLDDPNGTLTISFKNLAASAPLAAKHFVGLERLVNLNVYSAYRYSSFECGFLAPLQSLRTLMMNNVAQLTCELDVPLSLRKLSLFFNNATQLPMAPALEELSVYTWTELRPPPMARCDSLRELLLYYPKMTALPDGWLVNCSRLEVFHIKWASYLTTLPATLLVGTKALQQLSFKGAFETLPARLFDYSPNLNSLELSSNRLKILPSDMFEVARRVQKLDLSLNKLESSALTALAPLVELTELNLGFNRKLGDVCGTNGYSPIRNSTKLKKLVLEDTGVTRICRDWREDMTLLETLDLSWTKVTKLSFQDLQFTRTVEAKVKLTLGTPVTLGKITREDYKNERTKSSKVDVHLYYLAPVECDCSMYWTRRVLDLSGPVSRLVGRLTCSDGGWLRDVPPEEMVCARLEECAVATLPAACACDERPDDDSDHDSRLVRVRCENAGLHTIPQLHSRDNSTERLYKMLLAGNNISELLADGLMNNIKGLDLRNNSLRAVNEETAKRLGDIDGTLRLAGNPFDCSCRAAPLLRALHARNATQIDLINSSCSDGSPLDVTPIEDCLPAAPSPVSLGTWFAVVLGVLLVIVVSVVLSLASRERRFFMLAVLHRWGFVWRTAEPEEDENCRYDAFVTFSHKDEALVPKLIARLEPTYRLCVHCRDWVPGSFISEQVVESVRESRRTIALVSRHFLASSWARAEFREAHAAAMLDARPRLIVVLLEEPAALEMDDLLRRYVATHTYLRWGEPWFWDKLSVALPRPRAPRAPDHASPASPAVLALEMSPACNRAFAVPPFAVHSESTPECPLLS